MLRLSTRAGMLGSCSGAATVSFAGARAGHLEEELEEKRRALLGKHLA